MEHNWKPKLLCCLLFCVAGVWAARYLSHGLSHFREGQSTISVTGMAERRITSDLIVWDITVHARATTRAAAYEQFKLDVRKVKTYLQKNGIPDTALTASSVRIEPITQSVYNAKMGSYMQVNDGYSVQQRLSIRMTDLPRVEKVYQNISELYNEGLDFNSDAPSYYYTKLNDLKMEMLHEAGANARQRAKTIAQGSKTDIGGLLSSSMGVFQIVGDNTDEDYSWGGTFNTSSKEKRASITVKAVFSVD